MKLVGRVLLASVLALTGCSLLGAAPDPAPTPTPVSQFGGTDRAWIEITIAMDEQVVPLLNLVPKRSGSPELQALARQVKAFTTAELLELHRLRDAAGLPRQNKHQDMPMPGLVTAAEVQEAAELVGPEFDTAVSKTITEFLDQTEQLAGSQAKQGVEPQTSALAAQILRTRQEAKSTWKEAS